MVLGKFPLGRIPTQKISNHQTSPWKTSPWKIATQKILLWNFQGGSFLDTKENICEEFSSVHVLIFIFTRKIFILQIHSVRVYSRTNNNFFLWCLIFPHSLAHWSCKCPYWLHRDLNFLSHI